MRGGEESKGVERRVRGWRGEGGKAVEKECLAIKLAVTVSIFLLG